MEKQLFSFTNKVHITSTNVMIYFSQKSIKQLTRLKSKNLDPKKKIFKYLFVLNYASEKVLVLNSSL